jgi:hypothetical protein
MILLGSEGSIELVDERVILLRRPGNEVVTIEFAPPEGDPHDPGMLAWLTEVVAAVREREQVEPTFEDGVAVAEVMDGLRARLLRAAPQ